jgi:hypothetical protein
MAEVAGHEGEHGCRGHGVPDGRLHRPRAGAGKDQRIVRRLEKTLESGPAITEDASKLAVVWDRRESASRRAGAAVSFRGEETFLLQHSGSTAIHRNRGKPVESAARVYPSH